MIDPPINVKYALVASSARARSPNGPAGNPQ
jgi:hypothetical protein